VSVAAAEFVAILASFAQIERIWQGSPTGNLVFDGVE